MCGFIGIFKKNGISEKDKFKIKEISNLLNHRGPDQNGEWQSEKKDIFLSHKRLSINDLSEEGAQPMISKCSRYVLVYNGEIYNFKDLKKLLIAESYKFRGTSDTEVLLALIEKEGFENTLSKIHGMFSLALLDRKLNKIFLSRDATGQKPLYYYIENGLFFFTSELRNIRKIIKNLKISKKALKYFFELSYIPAPLTIYENVFKMEKGKYMSFDLNLNDLKLEKIKKGLIIESVNQNFDKINQFDQLFSKVIEDHLISDVKNGTLLSGGIDSTLVTFYANEISKNRIQSFCVKSNEPEFDESAYAEETAKKIGSEHYTLEFMQDDLLDTITNIHKVYDEPFGDSSQIPTFLLFKSVRNKIKVALSGDGGDEIFYGYNRYLFLNKHYNSLKKINIKFRRILSKSLKILSEDKYNKINSLLGTNFFNFGNKIVKISNALNFKNFEDFYFQIIKQDCGYKDIVKLENHENFTFLDNIKFSSSFSNLNNFQYFDMKYYLPDDIFVKVDRASMFNSIECRSPLVDTRVIEFSMGLKDSEKLHKNNTKLFLRQLLRKKMRGNYVERQKMGFGNPIGKWLKKDLFDWANDKVNNSNDGISEIINIELIKSLWIRHQSNKADFSTIIWNFIMFKNWYIENEKN